MDLYNSTYHLVPIIFPPQTICALRKPITSIWYNNPVYILVHFSGRYSIFVYWNNNVVDYTLVLAY